MAGEQPKLHTERTYAVSGNEDYFLGRIVKGSTGVVRELEETVTEGELFISARRLVLPLMKRHALAKAPRTKAGRLLATLQSTNPGATEFKTAPVGGVLRYPLKNGRAVVALTLQQSSLTEIVEESRQIAGLMPNQQSFSLNDQLHGARVRVVESRDPTELDRVEELLDEFMTQHESLELMPVGVCGAPQKPTLPS